MEAQSDPMASGLTYVQFLTSSNFSWIEAQSHD
jgi:hypothetical protein